MEQYCRTCGVKINSSIPMLYCSSECEQSYIVRGRTKIKIKQKATRKLSLDEQARLVGMSYAEYTTRKLLNSIPPIDLNIRGENG